MSRIPLAVLLISLVGNFHLVSVADADDGPLKDISQDMVTVVEELSDLTTGEPTQEIQKRVVSKLDKLIAQLEKECEACRGGSGSSNNPNKPLADSVIIGGPGGIGDLHAPRTGEKKWGELPPHERDRILQSLTEGFPAHYQRILERYYRRLAEEKPSAEPPDEQPEDAATSAPEKNPPK